MNITVLGWYGHGNCGDESYKIAFPLLFPDHNLTFVDSVEKMDLSSTDLILVGGGDVVKSTFMDDLYDLDIPMIAASVTITNGSDLKHLYKFKKIIVRDNRSLKIAKNYNKNVGYLPDFSFILKPNKENGKILINEHFNKIKHKLSSRVVTVILNSYIAHNHDEALSRDVLAFQRVSQELSKLSESMDSSWLFLPFSTRSPWDDRTSNGWVADRCKKKYYKNCIIYDHLPVQDTLDIIAASDVVISSRLHSTIFSTIAGVPFVDILHHDKNLGFIETVGANDWTTWLWQYDSLKVEKLIKDFLLVGGQGAELQKFTLQAKEQLKDAASFILR